MRTLAPVLPDPDQVYAELISALEGHAPLATVQEVVGRCSQALQKKDARQRSPLFDALRVGADLDVFRYLLEQSPPELLLEKDQDQLPLLHYALKVRSGEETIRCLVDKCPRVLQERNQWGKLPVYAAVERGASMEVLRAIVEPFPQAIRDDETLPRTMILAVVGVIEGGPAPQEEEDRTDSPMDVFRYLLDMCPEVLCDEDGEGKRLLHNCAEMEAPPVVISLILEHRPDAVRDTSMTGHLPVHYAARSSSRSGFASFKVLVEAWPESLQVCADQDELPIHTVLTSHEPWRMPDAVPNVDRVQYILDVWPEGARSKTKGFTVLRLALHHGWPDDALNLLLDAWPQSIQEMTERGESVLHLLSQRNVVSTDTVRLLVERDERIVDARSAEDGSLPVHVFAARRLRLPQELDDDEGAVVELGESSLDVVRLLVERRPESVLAKDGNGCLPVHRALASLRHDFNVLEYLVRQRPESLAEKNRKGWTPLHVAASRGLSCGWESVEFLMDQRPESVREADDEGNLAIHLAVSSEYPSSAVIRSLAERDPGSLLVRNKDGLSPLHLRFTLVSPEPPSEEEIASILEEHGPDEAERALTGGDCYDARSLKDVAMVLVPTQPAALEMEFPNGQLPLHVAASRDDRDVDLVDLFAHTRPGTAMTTAPNDGRLPLHCACANTAGPPDSGRRLPSGAPAGTRPTADMEWVQKSLLPLLKVLMDAAPEALHVKDKKGMTPLQVAMFNPSMPLDVLWFVMTTCPESLLTLRLVEGGELSPPLPLVESAAQQQQKISKRPRLEE